MSADNFRYLTQVVIDRGQTRRTQRQTPWMKSPVLDRLRITTERFGYLDFCADFYAQYTFQGLHPFQGMIAAPERWQTGSPLKSSRRASSAERDETATHPWELHAASADTVVGCSCDAAVSTASGGLPPLLAAAAFRPRRPPPCKERTAYSKALRRACRSGPSLHPAALIPPLCSSYALISKSGWGTRWEAAQILDHRPPGCRQGTVLAALRYHGVAAAARQRALQADGSCGADASPLRLRIRARVARGPQQRARRRMDRRVYRSRRSRSDVTVAGRGSDRDSRGAARPLPRRTTAVTAGGSRYQRHAGRRAGVAAARPPPPARRNRSRRVTASHSESRLDAIRSRHGCSRRSRLLTAVTPAPTRACRERAGGARDAGPASGPVRPSEQRATEGSESEPAGRTDQSTSAVRSDSASETRICPRSESDSDLSRPLARAPLPGWRPSR